MFLRIVLLLVFLFGAMVALLWIPVEAAGAVSSGADWVWYIALTLLVIPLIYFAIAAVRSRTQAAVVLTTISAVLLVGVLLTYPNDSVACTPAADTASTGSTDGIGDGVVLDDIDIEDTAAAGDCE